MRGAAGAALALAVAIGVAVGVALAPAVPAAAPAEDAAAPAGRDFAVDYHLRLIPSQGTARATIQIGAGARHVHLLRFRIDPARHLDFHGDGKIEEGEGTLSWTPPPGGGSLNYVFRIDHLRDERSYDSRCTRTWAVFRGGDAFPPALLRTEDGARARARLHLYLPPHWVAATPYPRSGDGPYTYTVSHPERRFDRPVGWIAAGRLRVVRERIAGTSVAVAGPVGVGVRHLDVLAFLRFTLPTVRKLIPEGRPERLLFVSAPDPMWRGGLSGPDSVFLHADRPLIDWDATSPVLHELMHVTLHHRSGPGADALVEGMAELYASKVLVRSRAISKRRYKRSMERLAKRGEGAKILVDHAGYAETARAVTVLRELDAELRRDRPDSDGLDEVVRRLAARGGPVTVEGFRTVSQEVAGRPLTSFFRDHGLAPEAGANPAGPRAR